MHSRIIDFLLFYPLFLFSLSCHEAAHAYIADKFGDSTARLLGRVSLSPLPHMDLIGTLILPAFGILTGAPVIGWGKPVPVNPYRLKGDLRRSSLWVAASGPMSNLLLAVCFAGLAHLIFFLAPHIPEAMLEGRTFAATALGVVYAIVEMGVVLNLMLAFFNLLPLPPLDGGTVIRGLLPATSLAGFDQISRYGLLILLVLFATGLLRYLFVPVMLLAGLLLPA
jgi:Zn-dependent protease